MTRRATLVGASVCVAFWIAVASAANVVGDELDVVRFDAATRFLDGGEAVGNGASSSTEAPRIENFASGDAISYSVALLRGKAPGVERGTVVVENLSSSRATRVVRAPVVAGRFKVLVDLVPGENRLTLAVGESRIDFFLTRRPDDNPRFVRLIYFVDSTGDETFATPEFWTAENETVGRLAGVASSLSNASGASPGAENAGNRQTGGNEAVLTDGEAEKTSSETARTGGLSSPRPNNFRAKIGTAALLWQTATAERLNDAGYGRRTFSLELDEAGDPVVWVLRGEKTAAEYAALSETERFLAIYREVEASNLATEFARYFVSVAFARKLSETEAAEAIGEIGKVDENSGVAQDKASATTGEAEKERIKKFLTISTIGAFDENRRNGENAALNEEKSVGETGETASTSEDGENKRNGAVGKIADRGKNASTWARVALGGGSVAALDASTLFSWPDSLVDVADAFADARAIPEDFAADSGFRRTRWALTASTLGAGLHELGHSFGLDHSTAPTDFMSRGFDRFNRIFTVVEPPDATLPNAPDQAVFDDDSVATWTSESAERLIRSRWIEK
ncbi:MAG: hypothetical protein IKU86_02500 [Thermoguttaceae bacterium]|nr:hypothetical protein [Thermoguttaceae bacterium]